MDMNILFGGSILAAFIAGIIALFAPCCISVMLPAYFAGAFQNRRQIVGMTLIFALGIATIIIPLVIGASFLINLINAQHTLVYLFGGLLMLGLGIFVLLGGQLHLPMRGGKVNNKTGPLSIYSLGVFSGVASACCAPVLAGVIALSTFATTFSLVLLLGIAYVMGMVLPLLVISLFWKKYDFKKSRLFRPKKFTYKIWKFKRSINGTALASGLLLSIMGIVAIQYSMTQDSMSQPTGWQYNVSLTLQKISNYLTNLLYWVPNWVTGGIVIIILIIAVKITINQINSHEEGVDKDDL
ncbi:cytochrome c biogenesis CcdA family protein [Haloplasma contractile]|uniref:C-type cytochrome biosis protein n=1 Tax=Haloplasma contractile SSD-17B TaxID=1033810 RepID=F7PW94_9MOLU|nr:cytochrome c biogenesis CcdA family protein [Haloplasma contractile]ERJ11248.1 C-type cytochrome biosis protein [Haloplasma contractile SSD-17B]